MIDLISYVIVIGTLCLCFWLIFGPVFQGFGFNGINAISRIIRGLFQLVFAVLNALLKGLGFVFKTLLGGIADIFKAIFRKQKGK